MKATIKYSTESSTKVGTFVTGLGIETVTKHPQLGEILSNRVLNIKTSKQLQKDDVIDIDLTMFDIKQLKTEQGISDWLVMKAV